MTQLALYGSFAYLGLVTVAVIAYAGPLFITVLMINPGTDVFTGASILPAVAALFYANSLVNAKVRQ